MRGCIETDSWHEIPIARANAMTPYPGKLAPAGAKSTPPQDRYLSREPHRSYVIAVPRSMNSTSQGDWRKSRRATVTANWKRRGPALPGLR